MKNKMTKWVMAIALVGLIIVFTACAGEEESVDKGREAAIEFCNCYENNTKENCLENLKGKYGQSQYMSDEFIKTFNETNTCGIELIKEPIKSTSLRMENKQDSLLLIVK